MADPKFFQTARPFSLKEISGVTKAEIFKGSDASYTVADVAPLDKAGPKDLSFFDNVKYKEQFLATKAGACLVSPATAELAPKGVHLLVSKSPYKAYALAAQMFYPEARPAGSISARASVHATAKLGKGCVIEDGVVIGEGAELGEGCWIEANAVIGRNVKIGAHGRVGANASVSHALIGDHVRIYPGARIGQDGFGFAIDPAGHVKVPQLGRVIIEDHVEIGANTTIDRGSGPDTVIGQGTWIDNLVQVGHNVKIGKGCVVVAQVGISGSTVIEDFVALGGQVGIAGHLRVGKGAQIAAQSGVIQDVPAGETQMGYPSMPKLQFLRQAALLKRLIKKEKAP
ncbi:MAG: UDP-3-O-(3-hydroxymyristoyl)glucosamine N-acyltransferase [Alphaproteobacteria bacterium PRO2]|nr:UDP-3-O-(3-hydroxymyristoyl)glucosamine N-acyltransferase [Alphaproteobacteria bacterium PRO2]